MTHRVHKLVLPVAGLGKRLRPLTNRTPKALVRLNGGPLLSYMLTEAEASGITEAIVVLSPQHKRHFERYLKAHAKDFPGIKKIHLRVQEKPLGDGHAVIQAGDLLARGPVAVRFSDDLIIGKTPVLASIISSYERVRGSIMLLERISEEHVSKYGIVEIQRTIAPPTGIRGKIHRLKSFVEKPAREEAPSNLGVVGGYVLTPEFVGNLKRLEKGLVSEEHDALRLADVFRGMLHRREPVYGYEFSGVRLDCGTLEGFTAAEKFLRGSYRS